MNRIKTSLRSAFIPPAPPEFRPLTYEEAASQAARWAWNAEQAQKRGLSSAMAECQRQAMIYARLAQAAAKESR